jgi:hypothetical protein
MNRLAKQIAVFAALGLLGSAQAATVFFGNLALGAGGPASPNFASLTITPNGQDADLVLNAYGLDQFGAGAYLSSIVLNVSPGSSAGPCCSNVSGGSPVQLLPGGGASFPGVATAHFDFTGSGPDLLTDNESVQWTWSGPFSIGQIDFAANVQGVTLPGSDASLWYMGSFAAPVPEPDTYALLLSGLAIAGSVARRRLR